MQRSDIACRTNTSCPIVSLSHIRIFECLPLGQLIWADTEQELDNRNKNAPLLRYVESVRRHGHRAAQIDPLDLMDRE